MEKTDVRAIALMTLLFTAAACGNDEPSVATRDEVIAACFDYNAAACGAFGRCLGWTEAEIDTCVEEEQAGCEDQLQVESCWTAQRNAYVRCSDIQDEPCADVCGDNGFCFDYRPYYCPAEREVDVGEPRQCEASVERAANRGGAR